MEKHFVLIFISCSIPFSPFLEANAIMNVYPLSLTVYLFICIYEYSIIFLLYDFENFHKWLHIMLTNYAIYLFFFKFSFFKQN